jgi:hypothetical protein
VGGGASGALISLTGTPFIQRTDSAVRATYGVQGIVVCAPHAHVTFTDAWSSPLGSQIVYSRRTATHAACASRNVRSCSK